MQEVIINSPSLDPSKNVSGISAVVQFIMNQNPHANYIHFEIGRKDDEQGGIARITSIIRSLKEWKNLLKNHPEALVHFNFALTKLSIIRDSLYIHFVKKNKLVVHLHGGNYLFADDMPCYISWLLKRLFKKDIAFIVLSDKEKEHIREKFHAQKVFSLPNCVDLTDAKNYERQYYHEQLTLGYIGRIAETKGMNELFEACKVLKSEKIPYKLIIAGSEREGDTYLTRFEENLDDCFEYAGVVSGKAKTVFLKSIDIFVLPSYFEGLPISLLETMSFGSAPVTTNVGSISSVVKDGENGLFIEMKDSKDIVEKIKKLSKEKKLLERLGRKARETIFDQFSPDKYIAELNHIYQI